MNREEKVHRAIVRRGFHEKIHDSFVAFVLRPRTAAVFFAVLLGAVLVTRPDGLLVTAVGLAAVAFCLGVVVFYALWFMVTYAIAYTWTRIVRLISTVGKAKKY